MLYPVKKLISDDFPVETFPAKEIIDCWHLANFWMVGNDRMLPKAQLSLSTE